MSIKSATAKPMRIDNAEYMKLRRTTKFSIPKELNIKTINEIVNYIMNSNKAKERQ